MDVVAQLRKIDDFLDKLLDRSTPESHHCCAHEDVFVSGGFDVHPEPNIKHRGNSPLDLNLSSDWLVCAGEDAKQRGLAGAIVTDQANSITMSDLEGNAVQGSDDYVIRLVGGDQAACSGAKHSLFYRAAARSVDRKFDDDILRNNVRHLNPVGDPRPVASEEHHR